MGHHRDSPSPKVPVLLSDEKTRGQTFQPLLFLAGHLEVTLTYCLTLELFTLAVGSARAHCRTHSSAVRVKLALEPSCGKGLGEGVRRAEWIFPFEELIKASQRSVTEEEEEEKEGEGEKEIVRNKAAEKAKHGLPGTLSPVSQATSVIAHAPPAPHETALQRPGSYSINGILGIPPHTDPNGNINKRKREDSDTPQFDGDVFLYR
ncbi:hypothetical protein E2C01_001477 [Portunus trituberculatus]|uniref:Uncharacterized protein n=1 Tax=Portunus trituberculatus TaxID=210409 RepID=A0A5B7CMK9_PORTR|nr:hypothetical protein [Portunus trituberculatus]